MAIGTGIKSVIDAGKEMAKSGFLKDTVAPGLKSAFNQAGGAKGLGKRVLGGAAIGGATTGTISALRGGDFWEGAKGGALAGGIGGAGRHIYQMGQTGAGANLGLSIENEVAGMTEGPSRTGGISNRQQGASRAGGISQRPPRPYDSGNVSRRPSPNREGGISDIPMEVRRNYNRRDIPEMFEMGVSASSGNRRGGQNRASSGGRRAPVQPSGGYREIRNSSKKSPNVSKQVHAQTRLNNTNKAAQSVVQKMSLF